MNLQAVLRALLTTAKGTLGGLSEDSADPNPISLFNAWFEEAKKADLYLPEAMAVATAGNQGAPSVRMMLLKAADERGFAFYTNYESRKADELGENPRAALLFYWGVLHRQVRVEGSVERVSDEENAAYFQTRARGSQLGAWASYQSATLRDRAELDERFRERESEFSGSDVSLPPFWGGYRLQPERIEFWQGRANRLHDRLLYTREDGGWSVTRLSP